LAMDPTGALIFKSAGRRPAGAEPQQNNDKNSDKNSAKNDQKGEDDEKHDKDSKDGGEDKEGSISVIWSYTGLLPDEMEKRIVLI
jgi:hypothetical protein